VYRVLIGALAILLTNVVLALDSEFKNTLNKVELNKISDSSYNINLYSAKEISKSVKVVKKSDLNYYILLPETDNAASIVFASSPEIKSVNAQLFHYAGADVKNGYTKINIVTSKPITFVLNSKTKVAANIKPPINTETKKDDTKTSAIESQAQKKNLAPKIQKSTTSLISEKKQTIPQKEVNKNDIKEKNKQTKEKVSKTSVALKPPHVAAAAKITPPKEANLKTVPSEKTQENPKAEPEVKQNDAIKQQPEIKEELDETAQNTVEKIDEQKETIEKQNSDDDIEVVRDIPRASQTLLSKFQNKILEYGISIRELILIIFAIISMVIILHLIISRQKENQTRLKSRADFIDKTTNKTSSLVAKKPAKKHNDNNGGKYFIFDKNVKQTGFSAPVSGNKNYELSSYAPISENASAKIEPYVSKRVKSEYDILQNILKEDAFIEIPDCDVTKEAEKQPEIIAKEADTIEKDEKESTVATIEKNDEPQILSSIEIAPQRGFMCVSYNNSINLIGYIFDDVFALYNFQRPKLEDYNIKFRMSEKTKQGANFLVRIGKAKMLVSVTKSSMNLEVAM